MTDIKSMTMEELTHTLREMGQPAFRGGQVFTWLHRGVTSFEEMSDLPRTLREQLAQTFHITAPTVARKQESRLDGTVKYLWELADGNCIETVLMQYHHGNTVCISSQVGCRMGCAFCASTIAGKVRDLTPSEMLDQVLFTQLDSGREISNIVLMGIGEPLDNMDTVLRFLTLVNHPKGLNIGMRHISLSTCGVIPGIRRLAELQLQLTLSVSLHAPDSETRSRIMPVNRAYDVEELFAACHDYFQKTGRRISFEYAMIDGVNDHDWQADLIARRIAGMPGHVNLIPLNDVVESPFKPSRRIAAFQKRLQSHGVTATVRRSLGGDIDASCGQLRRKAMQELYLDKVSGLIDSAQFFEMNKSFLDEVSSAEARIEKLESELEQQKEESATIQTQMQRVRELAQVSHLTRELAVLLVDRVVVGPKDARTGEQKITIEWNF